LIKNAKSRIKFVYPHRKLDGSPNFRYNLVRKAEYEDVMDYEKAKEQITIFCSRDSQAWNTFEYLGFNLIELN